MPYVTKEGLTESLVEFRKRGDERWALKREVPDQASIQEMVDRASTEVSVTALTEEDVAEIVAAG